MIEKYSKWKTRPAQEGHHEVENLSTTPNFKIKHTWKSSLMDQLTRIEVIPLDQVNLPHIQNNTRNALYNESLLIPVKLSKDHER